MPGTEFGNDTRRGFLAGCATLAAGVASGLAALTVPGCDFPTKPNVDDSRIRTLEEYGITVNFRFVPAQHDNDSPILKAVDIEMRNPGRYDFKLVHGSSKSDEYTEIDKASYFSSEAGGKETMVPEGTYLDNDLLLVVVIHLEGNKAEIEVLPPVASPKKH